MRRLSSAILFVIAFFAFCLLGLFDSHSSWALTVLKEIQVKSTKEVELKFDEKLNEKKIATEYQGDIFQLNLSDVSVYPAKIIPVNGDSLLKIFAYQYSPTLVRCRFSFKGKSANFKDRIQVTPDGRSIVFKIADEVAPTQEAVSKASTQTIEREDAQDEALLDKVMKSENPAGAAAVHDVDKSIEVSEKPVLASGKTLPSIWPTIAKLGGVIGFFLLLAFALKNLKKVDTKKMAEKVDHSGLLSALGRITKGTISSAMGSAKGPNGKMIQVVATHYLGPKKSIVVVKIAGKLLVLSVCAEAISLITKISDRSDEKDDLSDFDEDDEDSSFADFLRPEKIKTASPSGIIKNPGKMQDVVGMVPNATSRIKSRLEGLKPL